MKGAAIKDAAWSRWFTMTGEYQRNRIVLYRLFPVLRRELRSEFKAMVRTRLDVLRRES